MPFITNGMTVNGTSGGGAPLSDDLPIKPDDATGSAGVSTDASRSDHKHPAQDVSANAGNTLSIGTDGRAHLENSDVDHDLTTNFVANKHIDHSAVSINAGSGIQATGLGDITSSRTVNVDVAVTADVQAQTANKILDATVVIDEDGMVSNSDSRVPTQQSLVAYVANQTAGGVTYRGIMPVPSDLTLSATGNAYYDATDPTVVGDMYICSADCLLTYSDGTEAVTEGDALIVNTSSTHAAIVKANIDLIHSTTKVESVFSRTGVVTSASGDYTASQVTNVPAGDIAAITVQAAIDELETEKVSKSVVTTKGDILVATGSGAITRLPVGPDGQVLHADSLEATGVKWAVPDAVNAASETVAGIVELATSAETDTGTDNTRAITPSAGESTYLKKSTISEAVAEGATTQTWNSGASPVAGVDYGVWNDYSHISVVISEGTYLISVNACGHIVVPSGGLTFDVSMQVRVYNQTDATAVLGCQALISSIEDDTADKTARDEIGSGSATGFITVPTGQTKTLILQELHHSNSPKVAYHMRARVDNSGYSGIYLSYVRIK